MARYIENDDPWLAAAGELVDEVKFKRAEEEGRVEHFEDGIYTVVDGELEYVGTKEAVTEELEQHFRAAYAGNPDPLPADYYDEDGED